MRRDRLRYALTAALLLFLAAMAAATFATTSFRLGYSFNLDYTEGLTVANAFYFWRGKGLYGDIGEPPHLMTLYTPLYHLLLAPFSSEFSRAVFAGRLISLASFLAIIAMVFSAVRRRTGGVAIPSISCGFLISSYVMYADLSLAQINLLGVCLSVLGIWILSERGNKPLAFLVFLLAVCTKQSLWAGICAASVWIGISERPSNGIRYFGLFCLSLGLIVLWIDILTGGRFFLHTVKYLSNPLALKRVFLAYAAFLLHYAVLLALAVLCLSWRRPSIWQLYLAAGLVLAVTVAKEGSGTIYFAEALASLLVCAGCALGELRRRKAAYTAALVLLIGQASLLLPECAWSVKEVERLRRVERGLRELSAVVKSTEGPVLTEGADLSLANGKDYLYQGPEPRLWDERAGRYSAYKPRTVLRNIEGKRFSLIAEYFLYRRDPEIMRLIEENYYASDKTYPPPMIYGQRYTVWLPRERGD